MKEHAKKGFAALGSGAKMLLGLIAILVAAVVYGWAHQMFSFEECAPGKPSMDPGAIALAIFDVTTCDKARPDGTSH